MKWHEWMFTAGLLAMVGCVMYAAFALHFVIGIFAVGLVAAVAGAVFMSVDEEK